MDTVDSLFQTPLTPEQLSAVAANGGWARIKDPNTQRVFVIAEQTPPTVDDDYIREKIAEAYEDSKNGNVAEWNLNEIKAKLIERLAKTNPKA
jgi:hypothetical protein